MFKIQEFNKNIGKDIEKKGINNVEEVKKTIRTIKINKEGETVYNRRNEPVYEIRNTTYNMERIMQLDNRFKDKIKYNEFSDRIEFLENPIDDNHISKVSSIIENEYNIHSHKKLDDAIRNVANENRFNPLKQILESLEWDGIQRINTMFTDTLGAENNKYNSNVAKLLLLGAINRLYNEGCKFDYCVILSSENTQGLGKSSLIRKLSLDDIYFTDSLRTLETDTNTLQLLRGKWFIELGELKALNKCKGGAESIKQFLSTQADTYRDSYARHSKDYKRKCVFVGTTNKAEYLIDDTGNRRFLPIICATETDKESMSRIKYHMYENTDAIINYVRQLWAEAMFIFQNEDYSLVLDKENEKELERLHKGARVHNPMNDLIQDFINGRDDGDLIGINSIYMYVYNDGVKAVCPRNERNEIRSIMSSTDISGIEKMDKPRKTLGGFSERGWKVLKSNEWQQLSKEEIKKVTYQQGKLV